MAKSNYDGQHVDVQFDGRLCIHMAECGRSKGGVFQGGRNPWCTPDVLPPDEVVAIVHRCPTGALTYTRDDGGPEEQVTSENTVAVSHAGPYFLRGDLQIDGSQDDMPGTRFRAALCRCGQSQRKPFCDGSHTAAGFKDTGAVGEVGPGLTETGGTLVVKRVPNGPLLVSGNLTIHAGTGRPAWRGTQAALCRCGASGNKPFCDGSHRTIGFQAD